MIECGLVTGGSRGIGKAIALQLSKDYGLHILINYRSNDVAAKECLDAIVAQGGSAELLPFDVTDAEEVNSNIETWINQNPDKSITVLVNNAGIAKDGLFVWMKEDDWKDVISTSLDGMFYVSKKIIPMMMRTKKGRIINMSSVSGVQGNAGQANYSAAKAGIIAATQSMAKELARMNITVNSVAPGFIETDMVQDQDKDKYMKLIPARRLGKTEEVANLVSFLASDKAAYITGEVININGGMYT